MSKKRICVCFFGVIGRSIRFTYKSFLKNLIEPLKKDNRVDVYVFNLDVGTKLVDNNSINAMHYRIIKADYCEHYRQDVLDKELQVYYRKGICRFRRGYSLPHIRNALRQIYSEYRVGMFLEKHINDYDSAIVCGPDYYLLQEINIKDVEDSMNNDSSVYTTVVNDGQGYTNGFYIGSLNPMIKILKRYELLTELLPTKKDYEFLLKKTFEIYNISRKITNMLFVKVRNSGAIARQGIMQRQSRRGLVNSIRLINFTELQAQPHPNTQPESLQSLHQPAWVVDQIRRNAEHDATAAKELISEATEIQILQQRKRAHALHRRNQKRMREQAQRARAAALSTANQINKQPPSEAIRKAQMVAQRKRANAANRRKLKRMREAERAKAQLAKARLLIAQRGKKQLVTAEPDRNM